MINLLVDLGLSHLCALGARWGGAHGCFNSLVRGLVTRYFRKLLKFQN
jgi:hypothetical protein